ncbi:MAG: hypothetical protein MHM6MM_005791 [Cercozoa sp. M6MM]
MCDSEIVVGSDSVYIEKFNNVKSLRGLSASGKIEPLRESASADQTANLLRLLSNDWTGAVRDIVVAFVR